jgi:mannitol operon transcriptional antiterminator
MLACRPREILRTLVTSTHPLKIQELADRFKVSPRTVKYDLDAIRSFLKSREIELFSRPNTGLWVHDAKDSWDKLADIFNDDVQSATILSPQERVKYIATWVLLGDEPVTFAELAEKLFVSRNTVISDVKQVETLLLQWNVGLERQARVGLRATADEMNRRKAIEYTVLDLLNGSDMFQVIQRVLQIQSAGFPLSKLTRLFILPESEIERITDSITKMVQRCKASELFLADRDIIGVFIRMCIVARRSQIASTQGIDVEKASENGQTRLSGIVKETLQDLSIVLNRSFSESDFLYVSLYFVSDTYRASCASVVTRRLIQNVQRRLGVDFESDTDLFDSLVAHIGSRLAKYQHGVPEPNPLVSDIARSYRVLFTHVKQACVDVFAPENIHLGDSDVAYLVLHFAAAHERLAGTKRFSALVVCSSGRGSARFLKTFFENEAKRLHVVACCSVSEVSSMLESVNVDIVITALPIEIQSSVPVVQVNHLPTKIDVASVCDVLGQLDCTVNITPDAPREVNQSLVGHVDALRSLLSTDVLRAIEITNQDIIAKGFELSYLITTRYRDYLTDESVLGLTLHILLMVNRLAFHSPYRDQTALDERGFGDLSELRNGLKEILHDRNIDVPESEVDAILRYFSGLRNGGEDP